MSDILKPYVRPAEKDQDSSRSQENGSTPISLATTLTIGFTLLVACALGLLWNEKPPGGTAPGLAQHSATDNLKAQHEATHLGAQLAILPDEQAASTLAASGIDQHQLARIVAAVKNHRMRLVRMPIAQVGGLPGQLITIDSGGVRQTLLLTSKLQSVALPIYLAGEVNIALATTPPDGGLETGILTTTGPLILPPLHSLNQELVLDIIAQ